MARWRSFYRGSIKRRFIALTTSALLLILAGAVLVLLSTVSITTDYTERIREMSLKQRIVSDIASDTKEVVMHFRGYLVFLTDYEYEMAYKIKESLDSHIAEMNSLQLTSAERDILAKIDEYFDNYFNTLIPQAMQYAQEGQYDMIRQLVKADESNPTNELIAYSKKFELDILAASRAENERLIEQLSKVGIYFIIYIMFILLLSFFIVRRVASDINAPLSELSLTASRFARGEPVHFQFGSRDDEIGQLSRSLDTMMITLIGKEDELVAQNEELLAQQDELQMQQEELQDALMQTEETSQLLQKRNQLVQALANTLDKQELLSSIIRGITDMTKSDKGMILRMNAAREYAAFGISQAAAESFLAISDESMLARIMASKELHKVEREATPGEKGLNQGPMQATDIYVPILGDQQELMACLLLTRIGAPVTASEEEEILGLATQISLALVKLDMYEESEYQRQLNYDMLNTIQEAIQLVDVHGGTIHVNSQWYELLDIDPSTMTANGMRLHEFKRLLTDKVDDSEAIVRFVHKHFTGDRQEARSMYYELSRPAAKYVQIYVEPLYRNGELFGKLLVHRDVTAEYEIDRMKSEFVSTVSHELRTPLASVLGFAELLLHRELAPERQRKYIATIHQEATRLTTLINDFLDLQRMESGKQGYEMKSMLLEELMQDVIGLQQVNAGNHTLTWSNHSPEVRIMADRSKLHQVFMNLISNAIKYSPNGGLIAIACRLDGDRLQISVTDSGLGIPEEAMPKLFDKFYRVDNTDRREIGGTGLGLAIVKEIIERHQGTITVSSRLGEGSCFIVTLPAHRPEADASLPLADEPASASGPLTLDAPVVLLIENDRSLAAMLKEELQDNGCRVQLFSEGRSAIAAMPDLMPDVVVIDLKLEEGYSGWEVIAAMRAHERLHAIPMIISSAYEEQARAAEAGVDHFLVKPFLPGRLSSAVQAVLTQRQA